MIELIESMEELIHQKKSNWTIKYVIDKILERIHWIFIPYRRNITPSPRKEFRLLLEKEKYKVFFSKFVLHSLPSKTLMSKCPKKNKTYTILIFVQVYSSNLWVNFDLQKLRILKKSKLESYRYLSHDSNSSSLVSIRFLRRKIRPKYWSVLK